MGMRSEVMHPLRVRRSWSLEDGRGEGKGGKRKEESKKRSVRQFLR